MHRRLTKTLLPIGFAAMLAACGNEPVDPFPLDTGPGVVADAGPGDTGPSCATPCGGECCADGQSCVDGQCRGCLPESDTALCARLGKICGPLGAEDNCGKQRSVASCGDCPQPLTCAGTGTVCERPCEKETDEAFCLRLGKTCGQVTAKDNCDKDRTAACGSCPSGSTCDQATNTCACAPTTDAEFCQAQQIECGVASGKDNCDKVRTVAECGPCGETEICDPQRQCQFCDPETNDVFCTRQGKNCGQLTALDNCGVPRTGISCGSCTSGKVCDENNICSVPDAPSNDTCSAPQILAFTRASRSITVTGDTSYATNDFASPGCPGKTGNDVVYVFDTTGLGIQDFTATVTFTATNNTPYPALHLRRSCESEAAADEMACARKSSKGPLSLFKARLPEGVHYLIVDSVDAADKGPFRLEVELSDATPAPENNLCTGAEPLLFDSETGIAKVSGDTRFASNHETGSCATASSPFSGPEVVYGFTLTSAHVVSAKVVRDPADSSFNPALYLRGACANAVPTDEVACTSSVVSATLQPISLPAGTYYLYVDGVSGTSGRFDLEVTARAPFTGGICSDPTTLAFDVDGKATVRGDTSWPGISDHAQGTCGGLAGPDIVYSFALTAPARLEATLTKASGSGLRPMLYLRSGTCGSSSAEVANGCKYTDAGDKASLSVEGLAPGTYYLFVDGYLGSKGAFTLDAELLGAASNDTCSAPELLSFDANGVARTTGDTRRGKNDGDGVCNAASGPDLVYRLVTSEARQLEIELVPTNGSPLRGNFYLRRACEQKTDEVVCASGGSVGAPVRAVIPHLEAGSYYLWVDSYSSSMGGPYSLQVTASPPPPAPGNDRCRGAEPLVFDAAIQKATVTGASTSLAFNDYAGGCALPGAPHSGPDVVYSFELQAPASISAKVTRAATSGSFKPAVYIRKDLCESTALGDQAACANDFLGTATATQINAPAGLYYVVIDGASGTHGDFDLEVSLAPVIDVPDDCFSAKFIDVSSGSATVQGDTSQATHRASGNCNAASARDLVYTFTTTSVLSVDITVTPTAGSGLKPALFLRSACDQASSEIGCARATSVSAQALSVTRLPEGTWFLWVDAYDSNSSGTFDLSIVTRAPPTTPPNDQCADAQVLVFDDTGKATASGDTRTAVNDYAGSCSAMVGGDVVYAFTLGGTKNQSVTARVLRNGTASASFLPTLYLRSDCSSTAAADEKGCARQSGGMATLNLFSLPPGTYYLIVDSETVDGGAFVLDVTVGPERLYPDTCAEATTLVFNGGTATVVDDTSFAHDSSNSLNCTPTSSGRDLVYKLDTSTLGPKNFEAKLTFTASGNSVLPLMYLRSACATSNPAEEVACQKATAIGPITLIKKDLAAGVYYLWVDTAYSGNVGPFKLDVTLTTPVSNDTCSDPQELVFGGPNGDTATDLGFTLGAQNDYTGTCVAMTGPDVVYRFTVPGPAPKSVIATVARDPAFTTFQPAVYIRSVCTSGAAADEKACGGNVGGTAGATAVSLDPGTYYLIVDGQAATSGAYDLHVQLGPPLVLPDTCASAQAVNVDPATGRALIVGDTSSATDAFQSAGCSGTNGRDLVYVLDTTSLGQRDLSAKVGFAGTGVYPLVYLRSTCASSASADEVGCIRGTSSTATLTKYRLPAGVYYLIVDTTAATTKGSFTVDLQLSVPPASPGDCASATRLRLDGNGMASVLGTTAGATNSHTGTCTAMNGPEAVYALSLSEDAMVVAKVTREAMSSSFLPAVYIRGSNCTNSAAGDQKACGTQSNGVAIAAAARLSAGDYYVIVDGTSATSGNFRLDVTTAPPMRGESCADAAELRFDATGKATAASDVSAAIHDSTGSCGGTGQDLVYKFTLDRPQKVEVRVTPDSMFQPAVYVRSTCDDTKTEKLCLYGTKAGAPLELRLGRLDAGTYYVWVDSYASTKGAFTLEVSAEEVPRPPAHDVCGGAKALVLDANGKASITDETTWATDGSAGSCDPATGPDLVYSFTLSQPAAVTAKVARDPTSPGYNPVVYLRSACASGDPADQRACGVQSSGTATASVLMLPKGTHYVIVDGQAGSSGRFTLELSTAPAVRGDLCSDALPLVFDPLTGAAQATGDTTLASNVTSGSCGSSSTGPDLVYTFTLASPKKVDIVVTPIGTSLAPIVYLRSSCDQTVSEITCKYNSTGGKAVPVSFSRLAAGTYYLWVDGYSSSAKGPFSLSVVTAAPPPAPANDTCRGAQVLSFDATIRKASVTGDTTDAGDDSAGTCDTSTGPDLTYRFRLDEASSVIAKVTRDSGSSSYNPVVYVRGDCESASPLEQQACAVQVSGVATAAIQALPPGEYYVIVDGQSGTSGRFNLEVSLGAPVYNDTCEWPEPLSFDASGVALVYGDNSLATPSGDGSCASSSGPDLVYSFFLSSPKAVEVEMTALSTAIRANVYVRTACDQTNTQLGCSLATATNAPTKLNFPRLSAGTYYVWADSYSSTSKGPYSLTVRTTDPVLPAPGNDECRGATELTFDQATNKATVTGQTTINAQNELAGTCDPAVGPDVVYYFVTSQPQKAVVTLTRDTSTTSFTPVVYLRGDCGGTEASGELTCVKGAATAVATVNVLPAGTWYVFVDGANGSSGNFGLEVALSAPGAGPENESCFAPKVIALPGTSASVLGSTVGAQNEASGTCSSSTGLDVVYALTLPHEQKLTARVTPANASGYAPAVYIRRSCGSLLPADELACASTSTGNAAVTAVAKRAPAGDYWIWVDSGSATAGNFTLDVSVDAPVPAPANNTCATATPLTRGVKVSGDTTDADPTYGPTLPAACGSKAAKGPDVVYSFTPVADGRFTVTVIPTGFDAMLWYSGGVCSLAACAGYSDKNSSGGAESLSVYGVAGATYYFFVDGYAATTAGAFTIEVQ